MAHCLQLLVLIIANRTIPSAPSTIVTSTGCVCVCVCYWAWSVCDVCVMGNVCNMCVMRAWAHHSFLLSSIQVLSSWSNQRTRVKGHKYTTTTPTRKDQIVCDLHHTLSLLPRPSLLPHSLGTRLTTLCALQQQPVPMTVRCVTMKLISIQF